MLWHEFFARSHRPQHARWAEDARTQAERVWPGVSSAPVQRLAPEADGPPLPPPMPVPEMAGQGGAGEGAGAGAGVEPPEGPRPGAPPRPERRGPRPRERSNR
jgi:hypothetical protein